MSKRKYNETTSECDSTETKFKEEIKDFYSSKILSENEFIKKEIKKGKRSFANKETSGTSHSVNFNEFNLPNNRNNLFNFEGSSAVAPFASFSGINSSISDENSFSFLKFTTHENHSANILKLIDDEENVYTVMHEEVGKSELKFIGVKSTIEPNNPSEKQNSRFRMDCHSETKTLNVSFTINLGVAIHLAKQSCTDDIPMINDYKENLDIANLAHLIENSETDRGARGIKKSVTSKYFDIKEDFNEEQTSKMQNKGKLKNRVIIKAERLLAEKKTSKISPFAAFSGFNLPSKNGSSFNFVKSDIRGVDASVDVDDSVDIRDKDETIDSEAIVEEGKTLKPEDIEQTFHSNAGKKWKSNPNTEYPQFQNLSESATKLWQLPSLKNIYLKETVFRKEHILPKKADDGNVVNSRASFRCTSEKDAETAWGNNPESITSTAFSIFSNTTSGVAAILSDQRASFMEESIQEDITLHYFPGAKAKNDLSAEKGAETIENNEIRKQMRGIKRCTSSKYQYTKKDFNKEERTSRILSKNQLKNRIILKAKRMLPTKKNSGILSPVPFYGFNLPSKNGSSFNFSKPHIFYSDAYSVDILRIKDTNDREEMIEEGKAVKSEAIEQTFESNVPGKETLQFDPERNVKYDLSVGKGSPQLHYEQSSSQPTNAHGLNMSKPFPHFLSFLPFPLQFHLFRMLPSENNQF